jgi:hypothetical protein
MPTQLIRKYLEEFARWLRNEDSYDDWERGMEPIPGDRTWANKKCGECKSCSCKIEDKDVNR